MEQIADATWPRMALRHFALGLVTKKRRMIKKVVSILVQKLSCPSQNETCLVNYMVLVNPHLWTVVLPSYLSRNVTPFYLLGASDF